MFYDPSTLSILDQWQNITTHAYINICVQVYYAGAARQFKNAKVQQGRYVLSGHLYLLNVELTRSLPDEILIGFLVWEDMRVPVHLFWAANVELTWFPLIRTPINPL